MDYSKYIFIVTSSRILGNIILHDRIRVDLDKIKAIIEMHLPKTHKQVKSFLERLGLLRYFIVNFALNAKSLTNLLMKEVSLEWTPQA